MKVQYLIIVFTAGLIFQPAFAQDKEAIEKRPLHIGIIYPISTNATHAPKIVNHVSFQALAGISAGIEGVEYAGFLSKTNGDVIGCQFSGVVNIAMHDEESPVIGIVGTPNNIRGLQAAGLVNIAGNTENAVQAAGLLNISNGDLKGIQIAGLLNTVSGTSEHALQISGFINQSENFTGVQIGDVVNKALDVNGIQISGLVNIARNVKGVQISGLVNVADSSDYPIGMINIIKNGTRRFRLSRNELSSLNLSFVSGSKRFYGIIGAGYNPFENDLKNNIHYGVGLRGRLNDSFSVALEGTHTTYANITQIATLFKNDIRSYSLFMLCEYQLHDRFGVRLGPSLSYLSTDDIDVYDNTSNDLWHYYNSDDERYEKIFVGFTVGVYVRVY
jgi:hypothetical protein